VAFAEFDGICSGDIMVFQAKNDVLLPELLPFIVQSEGFFHCAVDTSAGSLSPRTKFNDLANYEFLLPPKEEQARLAELLWAADEVVEREKEVKESLNVCRQSLMKDLFVSVKSTEMLSNLPIKEINGLWKTDENVETIDVNVIRSTEFAEYGKINFETLETMPVKVVQYRTRKLYPNDIIVERSGGGPDQPVGRVCFFEKIDGEFSFSNFTSCIRVSDETKIKAKYLFYYLQFFWEMKGTDRIQNQTTGIRNLDYELFKRIQIPICAMEKQEKIICGIDNIQTIINNANKQMIDSQQLKSVLINQIF
jgi:type I restriction enzyme S subunit